MRAHRRPEIAPGDARVDETTVDLFALYRRRNAREWGGRLPSPLATWSLYAGPAPRSVVVVQEVDGAGDRLGAFTPPAGWRPALISVARGGSEEAMDASLGREMGRLAAWMNVVPVRERVRTA
jgi:hypothetical protein